MQTETQKQQKNREGFRNYYNKNRDDYNEKRRKRYADNPDARRKARERAAKYRAQNKAVERELYREVNGRKVRVFSTGEIAQEIERTPQMLRNWESKGIIPEPVLPDKHRLYTAKQRRMIIQLASTIEKHKGSWTHPSVKKAIESMHRRW